MKTVLVSLLGWMFLLYGCSYGVDEDVLPSELPVPVRMAIEEGVLTSRAPVTVIDASNLSNIGIYGVRESTTSGLFPWTASPFAANVTPSAINGNQISFNPTLYYPLGGKRIVFYGYYPRTTAMSGNNYIVPPSSGTSPSYHFTLTGAEDVMYAVSAPAGSTSPLPIGLAFNHKLTQLKLNTSLLGSLSSIKIVGVPNKGTLDIGTGAVTYDSSITDITLSVPLLSSETSPVMVPAGVASYKVEVVLVLSILKRTYLIKPTSGSFQEGVIYSITL